MLRFSSRAQPALSAAVRHYAFGTNIVRSHGVVRSAVTKQMLAPALGAGLYRHMSTDISKATFIDPTKVAPAGTSEDAAEVVGNASTTLSDFATQNAEAIGDAAMKYGDLKAMGLVHFTPVGALETVLEAVHISTGLPWWATIATTTVLIRTALLPFIVKLQGNTARLHNVKPQLDRLTQNMKLAQDNNDTAALARFSAETQELFAKNDCNPMKTLMLPLLQAPVMISFYLALRDMANLPVPQFKDGGIFWFTDLTVADPTYILPVVSSLGFLAIMELGSEIGGGVSQPKGVKNFMRFMAVAMVPLTMSFPSAIFTYWLTSNMYTVAQIGFFRVPAVRRFLNIPQLIHHPKAKVQAKHPGFMESFKASYEGGLAAKQKEITAAKDRENLMTSKLRRQSRKRI